MSGAKASGDESEVMSALPPKADMCSAVPHVRFGPQADMCSAMRDVRFGPIADIEGPVCRLPWASDKRSRARQDNPDFGELAELCIDLD